MLVKFSTSWVLSFVLAVNRAPLISLYQFSTLAALADGEISVVGTLKESTLFGRTLGEKSVHRVPRL